MYSGMADVAALTSDTGYIHAIDRIWDNVVTKKLYITGGIGATNNGEAFGENYELPNMSAYCETCAAIGNVYWNYRLFLLHGESKYYDVLERTLYNGLISGCRWMAVASLSQSAGVYWTASTPAVVRMCLLPVQYLPFYTFVARLCICCAR